MYITFQSLSYTLLTSHIFWVNLECLPIQGQHNNWKVKNRIQYFAVSVQSSMTSHLCALSSLMAQIVAISIIKILIMICKNWMQTSPHDLKLEFVPLSFRQNKDLKYINFPLNCPLKTSYYLQFSNAMKAHPRLPPWLHKLCTVVLQ